MPTYDMRHHIADHISRHVKAKNAKTTWLLPETPLAT